MSPKFLANMKTINNNSISFLTYNSKKENALNILFLGTMHGEEPQGDFLINKFLEKIKSALKALTSKEKSTNPK